MARRCRVRHVDRRSGAVDRLSLPGEPLGVPLRPAQRDDDGFCAPGIVLSATELLDDNPDPDRRDIQEALSGNLCRCTGYEPIIDAVLAVGRRTREVTP